MSFAVAKYRSAKTTTASPVQIVVQLYEGALKFMRQAQDAIAAKDFAAKGRALSRAHAIVSELQATLRPEEAPELCEQLYGLYDYVCHSITQANLRNDAVILDSPMKVLEELRGAWAQLAEQHKSNPPR